MFLEPVFDALLNLRVFIAIQLKKKKKKKAQKGYFLDLGGGGIFFIEGGPLSARRV